MNGVHHTPAKHEKMYPGFSRSMSNLFEPNRLIDDRPHRAGSKSCEMIMTPSVDPIESDFSNIVQKRKSRVTPMRTLIAQEMSAEEDPNRAPPNLVAKLMGIDVLPQQEHGSTSLKSHSRVHARSYSDIPMKKDVHKRWEQSPKSQQKGRYKKETMNNRKMNLNLIREKFAEAKHLSVDEHLRQSKKFHDALDVLSSNKDLFLRCLDESNSKDLHSLHPPPETNRITVLRPSKVTNSNSNNDSAGARYRDEQQIKRGTFLGPNKSGITHNSTQPTQIVVLKPNSGTQQNNGKAMVSPKSGLPNILLGEDLFEDDECREAREVKKEIPQQMHEKLGMHQRDETVFSSVFSKGYVGDESSFDKSETEATSPVSRYSWDFSDRLNSTFSSSYTRASYSPESSSCREGKKRLSGKWETMTSSGSYREQILFERSTRTLGDIFALSDKNKEVYTREEPKNSDVYLDSEQVRQDKIVGYSPRNRMRSKSVPVFGTEFETGLNVGVSVLDKRKSGLSKDTKEKSVKSSLRGKVSSLFFSKGKKRGIHKSFASDIDETHSFPGEFHNEKGSVCASPGSPVPDRINKHGIMSRESVTELSENRDQRSLVSDLDTPLEENEHTTIVHPHCVNPHDQHVGSGNERPLNSIGPSSIGKSPPIGSIARTPRDNSCVQTSASHPLGETLAAPKANEEQECFYFVKTLLSMSRLQDEAQLLAKWHSPESPLDPSLRDSYTDANQKLMFDCVNEVLMDIARYELESGRPRAMGPDSCLLDEVCGRMKVCFSIRDEGALLGDENVMADMVVRKEAIGKGWDCCFRSEMDGWRVAIEGELLEDLVQEVVLELLKSSFTNL